MFIPFFIESKTMNTKYFLFKNGEDWFVGCGDISLLNNQFEGFLIGTTSTDALYVQSILFQSCCNIKIESSFQLMNQDHFKMSTDVVLSNHITGGNYQYRDEHKNNPDSNYSKIKNILNKHKEKNETETETV